MIEEAKKKKEIKVTKLMESMEMEALEYTERMVDLDLDEELDKEITLEDEDIEDREIVEGEQTHKDKNMTINEH